ncbi:hypothetical protein [Flavobacterium ginsenosidimutans]|uniref:hypothetical protein n=1 Tax=Flavobacterium ginsenosidimutans TaxID=687844 RepID=UPI000DAEBF69|nr:hypothetical protein [Flavobacterium ginsenosidimutans]KAF2329754.1 hypothetical protein DM444_16030 [Flavobacterium ginsenosidimutans]
MKVKLLTTISFLTYQLSISQTEKLLHGKVVYQNSVIKDVEVINKTAKTSTKTNDSGEFSILVKAQDSLLFFSKDYYFTRLKLKAKDIETNNITVNMVIKPEELDDVVITQVKFQKVEFDREAVNKIYVDKQSRDLSSYTGVNNGTIRNPAQISFPLGGGKPKKKYEIDERFKKMATAYCPPDFFRNNLKLNEEQKQLFLEFCDADPKSKTLIDHPNVLSIMDFLFTKNEEFKKLE